MIPKIYQINPQTKPRMTRSDKWKQRPCVMRYRAFKDKVRELGIKIPEQGCQVIFFIPMPKSWSQKKKDSMCGMPHQSTPDIDNLCKGLLDALYKDDSHIYDIRIKKIWNNFGHIVVEEME